MTAPAGPHPWEGWTFSAGWGSRDVLEAVLADPQAVLEVSADVARDAAGRWCHPVRPHRLRTDLTPNDLPPFGEDEHRTPG
ncbi:hypothetical protein [Kitasatospora camelliae]|uniref:Uncharacterized protein n=1 Tax=Kitasatospora camelliae TaxID=3156397 RepID=A0AAU8K6D8_9ACTN